MTNDADQCAKLCHEAAAAAVRHGGITVQITLLTERGYHLWTWTGSPPEALVALAAVPVETREQ